MRASVFDIDIESIRPLPYELGCLFAILERLQGMAYPKAAARTQNRLLCVLAQGPAAAMKTPIKMSDVYLARLSKEKRKLLGKFLREKLESTARAELPSILSPTEQGVFAVGYLRQRILLANAGVA